MYNVDVVQLDEFFRGIFSTRTRCRSEWRNRASAPGLLCFLVPLQLHPGGLDNDYAFVGLQSRFSLRFSSRNRLRRCWISRRTADARDRLRRPPKQRGHQPAGSGDHRGARQPAERSQAVRPLSPRYRGIQHGGSLARASSG